MANYIIKGLKNKSCDPKERKVKKMKTLKVRNGSFYTQTFDCSDWSEKAVKEFQKKLCSQGLAVDLFMQDPKPLTTGRKPKPNPKPYPKPLDWRLKLAVEESPKPPRQNLSLERKFQRLWEKYQRGELV